MNNQAKMGVTWASPHQQAKNAAGEKPQREWRGLTNEEILEAVEQSNSVLVVDMARAIEAKLKEKNCG